jgi:hypothetical protein
VTCGMSLSGGIFASCRAHSAVSNRCTKRRGSGTSLPATFPFEGS